MAAGRHPSGGSVVTPIFLAPSAYISCQIKYAYYFCQYKMRRYWSVIRLCVVLTDECVNSTLLCPYKSKRVCMGQKEGADLNKSGKGLHKNVWEFIRSVDFVKQRINVIILQEVTAPTTKKVNRGRDYWGSIWFPCNSHKFCLVFLVVFHLFTQWNCMLQYKHTTTKLHLDHHLIIQTCIM